LQAYVKDAFEVRDGLLSIKAEKRQAFYGGKQRAYTSGMMTRYRRLTKLGQAAMICSCQQGLYVLMADLLAKREEVRGTTFFRLRMRTAGWLTPVENEENIMDRTERIAGLDNEVQAELVDAILSDRGIPHIMRTYNDSAYDGIFQTSMGWGSIEAPQSFRDEILAIIADVKQQSASAAAREDPEEDKG
jgi:hypothetical protein